MEVGLFFPLTVLVVGEQSQEEEDGREKLCSSNCSGNCFRVNRVDSKEKGGNLGNLLVCIVLADSKVELSDNQVEKQVDKVEAFSLLSTRFTLKQLPEQLDEQSFSLPSSSSWLCSPTTSTVRGKNNPTSISFFLVLLLDLQC
jgi:hypothetical protein